MSYYFSDTLQTTFEDAITRVTQSLMREDFGILTIIDLQDTLKKKINADFRRYTIIGACNPSFAYQALQVEDKIGLMLPCNVIVQEISAGVIEVAAVDPGATMAFVKNQNLETVAGQVRMKLRNVIENL